MDLRILGLGVLVLIVVSGGAVLPFLGFSALVYLLAFLGHAAYSAWQAAERRSSDDR